MAVNFGTQVTDPAAQARIMSLAEALVSRNEANGGGYVAGEGMNHEKAVEQAAYGFFPGSASSSPLTGPSQVAGSASGGVSGAGAGSLAGGAPAPTPYGAFTPPDPAKFADDPLYKFTLGQDLGAVQNSAASRGTYFTPNTMQGLAKTAQNDALAGYQQAYSNALGAYTTNRDTAAQNFGENTTQFNGNLAATGQAQQFSLASADAARAAQAQGFNQGQVGYENTVNANDTAYARARAAWIDAGSAGPLYGGYSQPGAPANSNPAPSASPYPSSYSSPVFSAPTTPAAPGSYTSIMRPQGSAPVYAPAVASA